MNIATDENDSGPAEPARKSSGPNWPWHCLALLALLGINFFLYAPTIRVGFLSVDDPDYVQNNPLIEDFSRAHLRYILTRPYQANYAPANLLSYSVDVALAKGKSAPAIHFSNILWNGFVVLTVYLLAFILRGEIITASAAALLFLLHPAHVEVVAWISSRKDLVATGFAVLSMSGYLLWRRQTQHNPAWFGASLLCFLIASAAKQSVLPLPLLMLIWDTFVEKRIRWQILFEKIPFGVIVWFFGSMTWHAQPSTNQVWNPFVLAYTELTNLRLLGGIGDFVMYRLAPDASAINPSTITWLMLLAGAVWLIPLLFIWKRQPVWSFLGYWILIMMIPPMLLNFIVPITDRYLFLPSVGACILVADLAAALATRIGKAWPVALVALLALVGFWARETHGYIQEWIDPRSVWYGAHLKTTSPQVSQFLGEVYQNAGDRIGNFVKNGTALAVTNEMPLANAILGPEQTEQLKTEWTGGNQPRTNSIAYRDKLRDLAWEQYRAAVEHRGTLSMPNLFMNRGRLLVSRGKFEQAIPEFQTALNFGEHSTFAQTRHETSVNALRAISVAYWNMREYKEALYWMTKAKEAQRKSGMVYVKTLDQEIEQLKGLAETQ